jgi:RIO kinase 1
MHEKDGGPRRERQRAEERSEAEHAATGNAAAGNAPAPEARPTLPPEFAAAVQVTESERSWIRDHLGKFHENELIVDVVRRIKAGKEATVYVCSAHPSTGRSWIAAKVYRERSQRSSKNVGQYQQGRGMLDEDGNAGQTRSWRQGKTVNSASKRGKAAIATSWVMHEFKLLEDLHGQGADVPEPIEHGDQAVLMEFIGQGSEPAPTLNDVALEPADAKRLFDAVIYNVELLLGLGWVHGDLSAYNILFDSGRIVLIDFPQVVDCRNNPRAREIFERDIERVTQYFESAGHGVEPRQLARELWSKHVPDSDAGSSASSSLDHERG